MDVKQAARTLLLIFLSTAFLCPAFGNANKETDKYNRKLFELQEKRVKEWRELEKEYFRLFHLNRPTDHKKLQKELQKFHRKVDAIDKKYYRELQKIERERQKKIEKAKTAARS
ncbi:MAG TPA: hypothetical protein PLP42_02165 [Acidobacteriota bacterium]|nr:hypothetical protein [Acidobacteriota bacterium]